MNKAKVSSKTDRNATAQQRQSIQYRLDEPIPEPTAEQSNNLISQTISQIYNSHFFKNRSKHIKIKLQSWMEVLQRYEYNSVWRTNKLNYLKILKLMCHCQFLAPPFTSFPNEQCLPILQKHEIDRIFDEVQRQVKSMKFQTKRQEQPQSQQISTKNRKKVKIPVQEDSAKTSKKSKKKVEDRSHVVIQKVQMSDFSRKSVNKDDKSSTKSNVENSLQLSKLVVKEEEGTNTVTKSKNLKEKISNMETNFKPSHLGRTQNERSEYSQSRQQRLSAHSIKKKYNSISDSINLEISPISVSSKVWQYTQKKESDKKFLNQTLDFSIAMKTTGDTFNRPSMPLKHSFIASPAWTLKIPKKQYWETNTYTSNAATPNYLNQLKHAANISFTELQNFEALRLQEQTCCDCSYQYWSQLSKKN